MKITLRSFAEIRSQPMRGKRDEPLHMQMGIATHVHRQAVLCDLIALGRGSRSTKIWAYDAFNRVWSSNHLFRASITLAGAT